MYKGIAKYLEMCTTNSNGFLRNKVKIGLGNGKGEVVLLFRLHTFYTFCVVLIENRFYFLNVKSSRIIMFLFLPHKTAVKMLSRTSNCRSPTAFLLSFLIWDWATETEIGDIRAAIFLFCLAYNIYSVRKHDRMVHSNRGSQPLAHWDITPNHECVVRHSFTRHNQLGEVSKHGQIVSK